jgi:hypothetical protein
MNSIKLHFIHLYKLLSSNYTTELVSINMLLPVPVAARSKAAATQSIVYVIFAMHGKNSCLYGQRKRPNKTAYGMYAMLAM